LPIEQSRQSNSQRDRLRRPAGDMSYILLGQRAPSSGTAEFRNLSGRPAGQSRQAGLHRHGGLGPGITRPQWAVPARASRWTPRQAGSS